MVWIILDHICDILIGGFCVWFFWKLSISAKNINEKLMNAFTKTFSILYGIVVVCQIINFILTISK